MTNGVLARLGVSFTSPEAQRNQLTAVRLPTQQRGNVSRDRPQRREEMAVDKLSIIVKPTLVRREHRNADDKRRRCVALRKHVPACDTHDQERQRGTRRSSDEDRLLKVRTCIGFLLKEDLRTFEARR